MFQPDLLSGRLFDSDCLLDRLVPPSAAHPPARPRSTTVRGGLSERQLTYQHDWSHTRCQGFGIVIHRGTPGVFALFRHRIRCLSRKGFAGLSRQCRFASRDLTRPSTLKDLITLLKAYCKRIISKEDVKLKMLHKELYATRKVIQTDYGLDFGQREKATWGAKHTTLIIKQHWDAADNLRVAIQRSALVAVFPRDSRSSRSCPIHTRLSERRHALEIYAH